MFEGIVSEVLNKALGTYIENLDSSKLKLSIWGGDVELRDLALRQSALDDHNLPFRPVVGHIGRLILKIPWSNLYKAQWVALVENVLVLVVPNTSIQYDAKREEKLLHDAKMATVKNIEEARLKLQQQKGKESVSEDSFQEKLFAQIIRNIQVTIKSIHIRYEDSVSCHGSPFASGVTLYDLSMKSTNSSWTPCLATDRLIYKLNSLECLGLYWNPNAELLSESNQAKEEIIKRLNELVASQKQMPEGMKYIIGPISSSAKLQINPKPEEGEPSFSIPVIILDFVMDALAIGLTRHQYSNIMALLDSFDRLKVSSKFRKYRPAINIIKGNSRLWWHYAYECKLEDIRRVRKNWSWANIKSHRHTCNRYKALYKLKLENKKLSLAQLNDLDECERALDVFNITLVRRQAEMEVEREGELRKQENQNKGWFSGWFSRSGQKESEDTTKKNLVKKLEDAMTDDDKRKLFEAIGYTESGPPPEYPKHFVNLRLEFLLKQLVLTIMDEEAGNASITQVKLERVSSVLQARSGADAFKIEASVQSLYVDGFSVDGSTPRLVTSKTSTNDVPLLDVIFETSPIDGLCDQRIRVKSAPLRIVYDAGTINQLGDVFAPPKDISLQQLQAAAVNQLEVVKVRSVTGLQSAIDNHSVLDLDVAFAASHIIVPERGSYCKECSAIVLTLGSVLMKSVPRNKDGPGVADLVSRGHSHQEVMDLVRSSSYDHFTIEVVDIQALVSFGSEDWMSVLDNHEASPLHLLQPTTLHIDLLKCLLMDVPNLPKVKISVSMPNVALSIVDERLLQLAYIAHSIPLNQNTLDDKQSEDQTSSMHEDDIKLNVSTEDLALARLEKAKLNPSGEQQGTPQFTNLALSFTITEASLELKKASEDKYQPLMKISVLSASVELIERTLDLTATIILGGLLVKYLERGEKWLLSTPLAEGNSQALLTLKFHQVDPRSPEFEMKHDSTARLLCLDISNMKTVLEQSAILSIVAFVEQLNYKLAQVTSSSEQISEDMPPADTHVDSKSTPESWNKIKSSGLVSHKKPASDAVKLKIVAKLGQVSLMIGTQFYNVAQVDVAGLVVNILIKDKDVTITSKLRDFSVIDPNPSVLHPKIVEVVGTEAWDATVSMYGEATDGAQYLDMQRVDTSITLTFGCARIVFLNKFVTDILSWVNKFQAAKAAVASVSVAAAVAAQATLQQAYEKCSRISLSLTLRAPLILIPQDSSSLSGLMVDLGQITISNKFVLGQERNELGYPAISDVIDVQLHNVKIARIELSHEGSLEQEHELLQPISLSVNICRNLTISWHRQQPELEVQANIKPIKVCMSEADMRVMMNVLQSNLTEESTVPLAEEIPSSVTTTKVTESERDVEHALAEQGLVFTKVKFSFTIEAMTLSLLNGGCDHLKSHAALSTAVETVEGEKHRNSFRRSPSTIPASDITVKSSLPRVSLSHSDDKASGSVSEVSVDTTPLAEVSLEVVTLKGEMMSNEALVANLVLFDCVINDTRPNQEGYITKMMKRKVSTGRNGMVDLTYHMEASKEIFVDMRISSFVLVMHLPYLLKVQRFFTDNLLQASDTTPPPAQIKDIKPKTELKSGSESQSGGMMTIRMKVEQPDIAIVEDVSSLDTLCIILHAEVNSDVRITGPIQHIAASISNLQIYTCCYNPQKRQKTLSQILDRCEMTFECRVTPNHAEHIDVKLNQVDLRVNPGTIELLSTIVTTLSVVEKPNEATTIEVQNLTGFWEAKPLNYTEYPFLFVEEAQEAFTSEKVVLRSPVSVGPGGEMAVVSLDCFLVTLEAGSATSPIPLIKLQASLSTSATGFRSEKLCLNGDLRIEVAYYNPRLAVWEPLLEPVEMSENVGIPEHKPWVLHFQVTQDLSSSNTSGTPAIEVPVESVSDDESDFEELSLQDDPITTVSVRAKDPLELTVTKTFMEVLMSLYEAFTDAYKRKSTVARTAHAPYRVKNQTGMNISVAVLNSGFRVMGDGRENVKQVMVESGAEVDLFQVKAPTQKHKRVTSLVAQCQNNQDQNILVKIPSVGCTCFIPVARADKRFYQVDHKKGGEKWGMVASISVDSGCKVITLSSCVQVRNHLDVTVDVYYMTQRGNEVEFVLSLKEGECALLPLHAVYTPTAELFFSIEGHSVCCKPFVWRHLQNNPSHVQKLQCVPRNIQEVHAIPFLISATGDLEQILWENTNRRTMKSTLYKIHLRPCLVLHNLLPIPISLEAPGTTTTRIIMPGSSLHLTKSRLGSMYLELHLLNYQSRDWVCGKSLESSIPELSVWTFASLQGDTVTLDLGMLVSRSTSSLSLSLYCPFWMINKTGRVLTYKGDSPSTVVHKEDSNEPILFSFKAKTFFSKKKAMVKVENSDWSDKFSLDVVGSSGSVLCKSSSRGYQIGVDIQLGNSGLTKMVIFSPFYKILNKAPFDLEVMEFGVPNAVWLTVVTGECIGWWPVGNKQLVSVRVRDTVEASAGLSCGHAVSTLLALPNKYGGVMGDVSMTEGGVLIKFDQYFDGAATALFLNHLTSTSICLWQQGFESNMIVLEPQTAMHYTWAEPGGILKMLWTCDSRDPSVHSLNKDDQGSMDDGKIQWVVFLNNNQRCLLFTDNINVASAAINAVELERFHQEIEVNLSSIGLSVVNDIDRKEIAYISLVGSGVVWEHHKVKGKKRRPFTQIQTEQLEKFYQLYQAQIKAMPDPSVVQSHFVISRNLDVDYATMSVSKPFNRQIQRTFQPGIWLQLKTAPHQRHFHLKVNSVQIDNHMSNVMFPVVLARVPPPRSILAETVPKPFCEVSIAQTLTSPLFTQYKYLAVLIQEFHVKVELPFIFSVLEVVFSDDLSTNLYSLKKYEKDISLVLETLASNVSRQSSGGQRDLFDQLHLSPIKMHLSFSLSDLESGGSVPVGGQVIHLFLQSVGVTLTEVQGVVFKLAYMERINRWMSRGQLIQEMMVHYRGQIIKQLYVVVLGLDVIGNPIGLVVGLTKGVEDLFYEPIQGAIEGPGEFAEGMLLGVSSFMGKTVGGAAGAMSRITGTIGKGVAALTLDDEYQKRRREAMHHKPADGIESLARGGKGLVTGVVDGVTGVFLKPIDGAREEGVEGFFKGMGKGVVGLVTRPASGVIDFASGSLDAVKRAADSTEEISQRRPARFIGTDGVVSPYVERYAQGAKILCDLEKGRFGKTDLYVAHAYVTSSKAILMATDKRVIHITRNEILGLQKVDWMHGYEELSKPPVLTPKGLCLSVRQEKKRVLGVFGGGDNSKVVHLNSFDQAQWFAYAMSEAYHKFRQ